MRRRRRSSSDDDSDSSNERPRQRMRLFYDDGRVNESEVQRALLEHSPRGICTPIPESPTFATSYVPDSPIRFVPDSPTFVTPSPVTHRRRRQRIDIDPFDPLEVQRDPHMFTPRGIRRRRLFPKPFDELFRTSNALINEDMDIECCICNNILTDYDRIVRLQNCGHYAHLNCINHYYDNQGDCCPSCFDEWY